MKYTILRLVIILIYCLACSSTLNATGLRWLTLRDGLAGMSATCLAEDRSGKVWIGTSNGISLYNGMSMKNYEVPRMKNGQANRCFDLALDDDGNLWAATGGGVYLLKRSMPACMRIAEEIEHAEAVICIGQTVYVGCNNGLQAIDRKSHKARMLSISTGTTRSNNSVRCLRLWKDELWMTVRAGMVRMNLKTYKSTFIPLDTPSGLSSFDICCDRLFIGTKNNGLFVMDPATGEAEQVAEVSNVVNSVKATPDGRQLCVATDGSGIYLIDGTTTAIVNHYDAHPATLTADDMRLPTNSVLVFEKDKEGMFWLGLSQNGLIHSTVDYGIFKPYSLGDFTSWGKDVKVALADDKRMLLASSGGFWLSDMQTGETRYFDTSAWRMMNINRLFHFNGYYYIGSYDGGLLCFDIQTETLSRVADCPELEYASITDMTNDSEGRIWVTSSEGLFVIDNQRVVRRFTEKNSRLPLMVNSICFDSEGKAWIGSSRGLCIYLPQEDDFKIEGFPPGFFNEVPRLHVLLQDDTIYAWSATDIYYSDKEMRRFGQLSLPSSIVKENCRRYLDLGNGNSLIVTEQGLFRIDNRKKSLIYLAEGTGLKGQVITPASLGCNDQWLWVGTNEGLMIAQRSRLNTDSINMVSRPMEIDYLFEGESMMTQSETMTVNDKREIHIGWNMGMRKLALMPVLADYANHNGETLEYRIDFRPWEKAVYGQVLEIRDLIPGYHSLQIRLAGAPGSLSEYQLKIYPTTAFYLQTIAVLVAAGLLLWWYRWRKRTRRLIREHKETEQALIEEMKETRQEVAATVEHTKYRNSQHSESELESIYRQMDDYVKEKRPFLDADLKMSDIAAAIGVSPSMLSQVFTLYLKEPYYDYINKYRLREFERLINEGKHKQFTVTALSEQAGFKKTSFFSTFRKIEGITPTEYIRSKK